MKLICKYCGYVIDRDIIINDKIIDEYINVYGTFCPNCNKLNKPDLENDLLIGNKIKMESLKQQVLNVIRKNREKKNDY